MALRSASDFLVTFPETGYFLTIENALIAENSTLVAEAPFPSNADCSPPVIIADQMVGDNSSIHLNVSTTASVAIEATVPCNSLGEIFVDGLLPSPVQWYAVGFDSAVSEPYCFTCPSLDFGGVTDETNGTVMQISHVQSDFARFAFANLAPKNFEVFASGQVLFDIKVVDSAQNTSGFMFDVACSASCGATAIPLGVIGENGWQTISVPVSQLVANGLILSDVSAPFVLWPVEGEQSGVVYRINNVRWVNP
jgi:hypothetical protein